MYLIFLKNWSGFFARFNQDMQQQFSGHGHYFRIQATLDRKISLDAATAANLSSLKTKAQETIDTKQKKINHFCALASSTAHFGASQLRRPRHSDKDIEDEEKKSTESRESQSERVHGFGLSQI